MQRRTAAGLAVVGALAIGLAQLGKAQTPRDHEDCVPYDPATLVLTDEGSRGWLISRDDGARFIGMDTKADADIMMAVFKAHSTLCYVGRDNQRPNRKDYVHMYWK